MKSICDWTAARVAAGRRMIIVTSGAVAAGRAALGVRDRQLTIARKQALAAGKIQAMAASLDVAVSAAEELPLKFVWAFDTSAGADGLLVKPEIKKLADLKGKQVAYHKGSASHLLLTELLAKGHLGFYLFATDDLDALRDDPGFRLALGKLPGSGAGLASQPTMSRWENAPTTRELARMMAGLEGSANAQAHAADLR